MRCREYRARVAHSIKADPMGVKSHVHAYWEENMKLLSRLLGGALVGGLLAFAAPVASSAAVQSCDTLTCTDRGCCTTDSETGEICDCEPWI